MIIGIGADLIENKRIARLLKQQGERFLKKIFTPEERKAAKSRVNQKGGEASFYAKRFAAKEACAKALGVGIGKNMSWQDLSITNLPSGKPAIKLKGQAAAYLKKLTPAAKKPKVDISLSDNDGTSLAFVVVSCN